jgi:hypothetical protein
MTREERDAEVRMAYDLPANMAQFDRDVANGLY